MLMTWCCIQTQVWDHHQPDLRLLKFPCAWGGAPIALHAECETRSSVADMRGRPLIVQDPAWERLRTQPDRHRRGK
jgi:hypothetical protein